jgi:protein-tyrosine phosphatase
LATGCDFHLSFENLQDIRSDPTKYTINQKSYLLVEFAEFAIPPTIDQSLHELQLAGLQPIITHPERNALIRTHAHRLDTWIERGCYVQVTALSLLGQFGPRAQAAVEGWLDGNRIHFIASDAHNTTSRPLKMREAFDKVSERCGVEVAQALCHDNPLAAFEGRLLPYVPEPEQGDAYGRHHGGRRRRKRFLFF